MNIAFLSPEYVTEENYSGGLANYLSRVSRMLVEQGHNVQIFVLSKREGYFNDHGVHVHLIMFNPIKNATFYKTRNILAGARRLSNAVFEKHRHQRIDIIQTTNYQVPGYFLIKSRKIPVVTRLSSFSPFWRAAVGISSLLDDAVAERLELTALRQSDGVYAPSATLPKFINFIEPILIDHIYPPFPITTSEETLDTFNNSGIKNEYILFYGTISRLKGIDFILRNLSKILEENSGLSFVFIGKFGKAEHFKVAAGDDNNRVFYFDALRKPELIPFIKRAKAIILPSKIDNLPNTCLESMAMSKVILTSSMAGFDSVIKNGENGFIVDYGDDLSFRKRIKEICGMDKDAIERIGDAARNTIVELFDPQQNTDKLVEYFSEIINRWKHNQLKR